MHKGKDENGPSRRFLLLILCSCLRLIWSSMLTQRQCNITWILFFILRSSCSILSKDFEIPKWCVKYKKDKVVIISSKCTLTSTLVLIHNMCRPTPQKAQQNFATSKCLYLIYLVVYLLVTKSELIHLFHMNLRPYMAIRLGLIYSTLGTCESINESALEKGKYKDYGENKERKHSHNILACMEIY